MTKEVQEHRRREVRRVTVTCQFCLSLNQVQMDRANEGPRCGNCGRPILLDRPVKVTDDDFDRVISGADVPVMVDFYADWCGPCKIMAPVLDEFAHDHTGQALVAKLNTDANQKTAQRFEIRGIPTLIVFKAGEEVARRSGAIPREDLEKLLALA